MRANKTTGSITVDKGIPLPLRTKIKYPFQDMEVGDSFIVPVEKYDCIRSSATNYGKRNNKKFSIRHVSGEVRCWRVG